MDRHELLEKLKSFIPAEFDEVVFRYNIPPEYLTTNNQTQRAIELIRYAESRNNLSVLEDICNRICQATTEIYPGNPEIFVSYARKDNEAFPSHTGWVTQLVNYLKMQPDSCSIFLNEDGDDNLSMSNENIQKLKNSKILLIVLSSFYIESPRCDEERKRFISKGAHFFDALFVVEKERVESYPEEITYAKKYLFWQEKYEEMALSLRDDIVKFLADKNTSSPENISKTTVFLAEAADDLWGQREVLKRHLEENNNIHVLPNTLYAFPNQAQLEQVLDRDLKKSALFVQLLGKYYAHRPTGVNTPTIQFDRAQQQNKTILQWRHPQLALNTVTDTLQRDLLERDTVMPIPLEEFQQIITRQLEVISNSSEDQKPTDKTGHSELDIFSAQEPKGDMVFISAVVEDTELANKIKRVLENNTINCTLSNTLENARPRDIRHDIERNLCYCNAVIVVYDNIPEIWVKLQLLQCYRIQGERQQPLKVISVCAKHTLNMSNIDFPGSKPLVLNCDEAQIGNNLSIFIENLQGNKHE